MAVYRTEAQIPWNNRIAPSYVYGERQRDGAPKIMANKLRFLIVTIKKPASLCSEIIAV